MYIIFSIAVIAWSGVVGQTKTEPSWPNAMAHSKIAKQSALVRRIASAVEHPLVPCRPPKHGFSGQVGRPLGQSARVGGGQFVTLSEKGEPH